MGRDNAKLTSGGFKAKAFLKAEKAFNSKYPKTRILLAV
jgi:hypothetical protein